MNNSIDPPDADQQDVYCPQCRYNLRGLSGDVVSCPECGARVDIEWVRSVFQANWYKTRLGQLEGPAFLILIFLGLHAIFLLAGFPEGWVANVVLWLLFVGVWLALTAYSVQWIGGLRGWGVGLASQSVFLLWLASFPTVVLSVVGLLAALLFGAWGMSLMGWVWVIGGLSLHLFARWARRRLSDFCRERFWYEACRSVPAGPPAPRN